MMPAAVFGIILWPLALMLAYAIGTPPALVAAAGIDIAGGRMRKAGGGILIPAIAAGVTVGWLWIGTVPGWGSARFVAAASVAAAAVALLGVLLLWPMAAGSDAGGSS